LNAAPFAPASMPAAPDTGAPPPLSVALKSARWVRALTPDQFDRVCTEVTERQVPAGGYIARRGDPVEAWLGVIDGLIKINADSPSGKSVTFAGVTTGGWLGEGSMLKDEARRYDVVALRDSRVAFMPHATFHWLLDTSIPFNRFLLEQLNERLGQFIAMVESDRLLDMDARVARCLAALYNPVLYPGTTAQLHISQEEVGYLSGASRQRVNQALQVLERELLLKVEYGGITILDLEGLRSFRA
jgi:CRP/FNR family cyclic AMP-dependent transcriptional regulator